MRGQSLGDRSEIAAHRKHAPPPQFCCGYQDNLDLLPLLRPPTMDDLEADNSGTATDPLLARIRQIITSRGFTESSSSCELADVYVLGPDNDYVRSRLRPDVRTPLPL